MVLDKSLLFSEAQAITADAASTNVIDLGALGITPHLGAQLKHNVGHKKIPLLIQVVENFATLTSLKIAIQSDDNDGFSSAKELLAITVPVAELIAGFKVPFRQLPIIKERYVRIYYDVNGSNATAGKITAGIVLDASGDV